MGLKNGLYEEHISIAQNSKITTGPQQQPKNV
jgi:hypothetical protein